MKKTGAAGSKGKRRGEGDAPGGSIMSPVTAASLQPPRPTPSFLLMDLNPANSAAFASEERQRSKGRGSAGSNNNNNNNNNSDAPEKETGLLKPTRKGRLSSSNPYRGLPSGAHIKRRPPSVPRRQGNRATGVIGAGGTDGAANGDGEATTAAATADHNAAATTSESTAPPPLGFSSAGAARPLRLDQAALRGRRDPSPAPTRPPRGTRGRRPTNTAETLGGGGDALKRLPSGVSTGSNLSPRSDNAGAGGLSLAARGVDSLEQSRRHGGRFGRAAAAHRTPPGARPHALASLPPRHTSESRREALEAYVALCEELGEAPREDWVSLLADETAADAAAGAASDDDDYELGNDDAASASGAGKGAAAAGAARPGSGRPGRSRSTRSTKSGAAAATAAAGRGASSRGGVTSGKRVRITTDSPPPPAVTGASDAHPRARKAATPADRCVDQVLAATRHLAACKSRMAELELLKEGVRRAEGEFRVVMKHVDDVAGAPAEGRGSGGSGHSPDPSDDARAESPSNRNSPSHNGEAGVPRASRRNSLRSQQPHQQQRDPAAAARVEALQAKAQELTDSLAAIQSAVVALLLAYKEQSAQAEQAAADGAAGSDRVTPLLSPAHGPPLLEPAHSPILGRAPPPLPPRYREFLSSQGAELVESLEQLRTRVTEALSSSSAVYVPPPPTSAQQQPQQQQQKNKAKRRSSLSESASEAATPATAAAAMFPTPLLVLSDAYETPGVCAVPESSRDGSDPARRQRIGSDDRGSAARSSLSQLSQRLRDTLSNRDTPFAAGPQRERRGSGVLTPRATAGSGTGLRRPSGANILTSASASAATSGNGGTTPRGGGALATPAVGTPRTRSTATRTAGTNASGGLSLSTQALSSTASSSQPPASQQQGVFSGRAQGPAVACAASTQCSVGFVRPSARAHADSSADSGAVTPQRQTGGGGEGGSPLVGSGGAGLDNSPMAAQPVIVLRPAPAPAPPLPFSEAGGSPSHAEGTAAAGAGGNASTPLASSGAAAAAGGPKTGQTPPLAVKRGGILRGGDEKETRPGKEKRSRSSSVGAGRKGKTTGTAGGAGRSAAAGGSGATTKIKTKDKARDRGAAATSAPAAAAGAGAAEAPEVGGAAGAAGSHGPMSRADLDEAKAVWDLLVRQVRAQAGKGPEEDAGGKRSPRPSTAAAVGARTTNAAGSPERRAESAAAALTGDDDGGTVVTPTLQLAGHSCTSADDDGAGDRQGSPHDVFQRRIAQMDSEKGPRRPSDDDEEEEEEEDGALGGGMVSLGAALADGSSNAVNTGSAAAQAPPSPPFAPFGDSQRRDGDDGDFTSALLDPALSATQRQTLAATIISAAWRGYRGRVRARAAAIQANSRRAARQMALYKQAMRARLCQFLWTIVCRRRLRKQLQARAEAQERKEEAAAGAAAGGTSTVGGAYAQTSRTRFEQSRDQRRRANQREEAETARATPSSPAAVPVEPRRVSQASSAKEGGGEGSDAAEETQDGGEAAAGAAPPPAPLPLIQNNISTKNIAVYGRDSEGFEVAVLHRLLQAPMPLLYTFSVCIGNYPNRPPMGYAKLRDDGEDGGGPNRHQQQQQHGASVSPSMDPAERGFSPSVDRRGATNDHASGSTGADSVAPRAATPGVYHMPFHTLQSRLPYYAQVSAPLQPPHGGHHGNHHHHRNHHNDSGSDADGSNGSSSTGTPRLPADLYKRKSSLFMSTFSAAPTQQHHHHRYGGVGAGDDGSELHSGRPAAALRLVPHPLSAHYSSIVDVDELRHAVPVRKPFSRPFEHWGNAHRAARKVFTAAAIYAWKLIFSHTPHDDFKQRQLVRSEDKRARLERVQQRNKMILACYVVRSEREWLREVSKDLSFAGQIYNPKRAMDPNDPNFEKNCRETFEFVEDFLYQCFPTINSLEEIPSFLLGAGIYFTLKESFHYYYSSLSEEFNNERANLAGGGAAGDGAAAGAAGEPDDSNNGTLSSSTGADQAAAPGGANTNSGSSSVGKRYPELLVSERVFLENYTYAARRERELRNSRTRGAGVAPNMLQAAQTFHGGAGAAGDKDFRYSSSDLLKRFTAYQSDVIHRYELLVLLQHGVEHFAARRAGGHGSSGGNNNNNNPLTRQDAEAGSFKGGDSLNEGASLAAQRGGSDVLSDTGGGQSTVGEAEGGAAAAAAEPEHAALNNTVSLASLAPIKSTPSAVFSPTLADAVAGGSAAKHHRLSGSSAFTAGTLAASLGGAGGTNNTLTSPTAAAAGAAGAEGGRPPAAVPAAKTVVRRLKESNRFPQLLRLPQSAISNLRQNQRLDGEAAARLLKQREEELLYYLAAWERGGGERRDRLQREYGRDAGNMRYYALGADEECVLIFPKNYLIQLSEQLTFELLGMKLDLSVCEDLESID